MQSNQQPIYNGPVVPSAQPLVESERVQHGHHPQATPFITALPVSAPPPTRKPSIVERMTDAAFGSGMGLKRVLTGSGSLKGYDSGGSDASLSLQQNEDLAITYSKAPSDYEMGPAIGFGSSAVVYIARYNGPTTTLASPASATTSTTTTNTPFRLVAVKLIDLDMFERNQIDELRREIQIMSLSKHPNLLPTLASFVSASKLFIITPFLSAGSCLDLMKYKYPMGIEEVAIATILKQALQGLDYLHRNGLIHRDVKAGNLLMDSSTGLVQLADFGVSSSLSDGGERRGVRKTFVGTPCWMSPEVMEQTGYDFKADIWSFGITAIELATGHAPYAKFPPLKVLMLTLQNEPPTLEPNTYHKYSRSFKDMIDSCLFKDPTRRPSAEKLLSHSFLKQAKKPAYLEVTLLKGIPPLTERANPNKKIFAPEEHRSSGISWDFDSGSTVDLAPVVDESKSLSGVAIKEGGMLPRDVTSALEASSKSMNVHPPSSRVSRVVFEEDLASFGNAGGDPPTKSTISPLSVSTSSTGIAASADAPSLPSVISAGKKSRFQVDSSIVSGPPSNIASPLLAGGLSDAELTLHAAGAVAAAASSGVIPLQRKGRFTVNDRATSPGDSVAVSVSVESGLPLPSVPSLSHRSNVIQVSSNAALAPSSPPSHAVLNAMADTTNHAGGNDGRLMPFSAQSDSSPNVSDMGTRKTGRFAVQMLAEPSANSTPSADGGMMEQHRAVIGDLQAENRDLRQRIRELEEELMTMKLPRSAPSLSL